MNYPRGENGHLLPRWSCLNGTSIKKKKKITPDTSSWMLILSREALVLKQVPPRHLRRRKGDVPSGRKQRSWGACPPGTTWQPCSLATWLGPDHHCSSVRSIMLLLHTCLFPPCGRSLKNVRLLALPQGNGCLTVSSRSVNISSQPFPLPFLLGHTFCSAPPGSKI